MKNSKSLMQLLLVASSLSFAANAQERQIQIPPSKLESERNNVRYELNSELVVSINPKSSFSLEELEPQKNSEFHRANDLLRVIEKHNIAWEDNVALELLPQKLPKVFDKSVVNVKKHELTKLTVGNSIKEDVFCIEATEMGRLSTDNRIEINNHYFYFFDKKDSTYIGSILYMNGKTGSIQAEYKIVDGFEIQPGSQSLPVEKINSLLAREDIAITPNPAHTTVAFEIKGASSEVVKLEILDMKGRLIKEIPITYQGEFIHKENVSEYPNGTYLLRVLTSKNVITKKFIIK